MANANGRRPTKVTGAALRRMGLPRHEEGDDKDGRGRVLVVAGATERPGAAVLAAEAALRAGAGRLRIATCRGVAAWVGSVVPEARVFAMPETRAGGIAPSAARRIAELAEHVDTILVGPGMIDQEAVDALVAELMPRLRVRVVLDAAALSAVRLPEGARAAPGASLTITPHDREFARVAGARPPERGDARLAAARGLARDLGATVVLKGPETLTVSPDGEAYENTTGNVGLATSGSGDVLAGVIAGLSARGADPLTAAVCGVFAHGRAGDRLARRVGPVGYLARELLAEIPNVLRGIR
jgi:hydroxyethylthiazole kinase-like uncharacterized protein yjeF